MPGRIGGDNSYCFAYQCQFAEKDEETGFNAFELRLYDSRIGRWMVPDPAGQYFSPYLGMGNSPIMGVDPDGRDWGTNKLTGKQLWFSGEVKGLFYSANPGKAFIYGQQLTGFGKFLNWGGWKAVFTGDWANGSHDGANSGKFADINFPDIDGGNIGKQSGGLTVSTAFNSGPNGPMNKATEKGGNSGYLNWDLLSWVRPSAGKLNVDRVPWDSNIRDVVYKTSIIVKTYPSSSPAPAIAPLNNAIRQPSPHLKIDSMPITSKCDNLEVIRGSGGKGIYNKGDTIEWDVYKEGKFDHYSPHK